MGLDGRLKRLEDGILKRWLDSLSNEELAELDRRNDEDTFLEFGVRLSDLSEEQLERLANGEPPESVLRR